MLFSETNTTIIHIQTHNYIHMYIQWSAKKDWQQITSLSGVKNKIYYIFNENSKEFFSCRRNMSLFIAVMRANSVASMLA